MIHRFIGLALTGAVLAGASRGASSSTLSSRTPAVNLPFTLTVPSTSQTAANQGLAKIAAATRSASLTVAAQDTLPAANSTTVACAATCAGQVSVPVGTQRFVAKLFSGEHGTGRMLAMGSVTQTIGTNAKPLWLTFNTTVASVQLALKDKIIPAASSGATTQLFVIARNPKGAVIVGPGSYVDKMGKPLTIWIRNSSPGNTELSPAGFQKPNPGGTVSNIATVTYKGRAHFHYPTFSVVNPGLAPPNTGVTLAYLPDSGGDFPPNFVACNGEFGPASVGGYYYGGPYFGGSSTACRVATPGHPGRTYPISSKPNGSVVLGFGSDKKVYFAYNDAASNVPTQFGYLRSLSDRTSANVASVSGLTLGNDGSLWFGGVWNGHAAIGKLPPTGTGGWHPRLFSLPQADAVLSIEPGIGGTEVFLFHAQGQFYIGKINTDLSGFVRVVRITVANSGFGDLLAGPNGTFYVSAGPEDGSVYRLTSTTQSIVCRHVQRVYRLSDGTGAGFREPQSNTENHAFVHVVPAENGCAVLPVFNPGTGYENNNNGGPFFDLLGIDSTTEDWLVYSNPTGHRLGVF